MMAQHSEWHLKVAPLDARETCFQYPCHDDDTLEVEACNLKAHTGVLFVCAGNICRSPTAEGVFRHHVERAGLAGRIVIASAGTHACHLGEPPDARSQKAARARGYDLSAQRARHFDSADYARFDFVLAMDRDNLAVLEDLRPSSFAGHLGLLMDFAPELGRREVPDPYYGGARGFEEVLELIERASAGLLAKILSTGSWQA